MWLERKYYATTKYTTLTVWRIVIGTDYKTFTKRLIKVYAIFIYVNWNLSILDGDNCVRSHIPMKILIYQTCMHV